ncbi:MAG: GTP 3',8-cyclase MoaA [Deltaproteobacteria bacterium]|nr:MAG: GTP 3',8-cyclase MoaA [Deltaproteobacteria bacterium]
MNHVLKDNYGRVIDYLRISITDHCNLRCLYCVTDEISWVPHEEILRFEEIITLVTAFVKAGIRKIRITGGEPLMRKGLPEFISQISRIEGVDDLSLTTNGVLLKRFARDLKEAGLRRINVSLDTLKPELYKTITGRDYFHQVWEGIETARAVGLSPVKINVVAMKEYNEEEILDFARLTIEEPYVVRFIEYMPVNETWNDGNFLSVGGIKKKIESVYPLVPINGTHNNGPARVYKIPDAKGEIGLISPLSNHFCGTCNRLRLTADGHLRPCLFSDTEVDVKTPLRAGADETELLRLLQKTLALKPKRHHMQSVSAPKCHRGMWSIGG